MLLQPKQFDFFTIKIIYWQAEDYMLFLITNYFLFSGQWVPKLSCCLKFDELIFYLKRYLFIDIMAAELIEPALMTDYRSYLVEEQVVDKYHNKQNISRLLLSTINEE